MRRLLACAVLVAAAAGAASPQDAPPAEDPIAALETRARAAPGDERRRAFTELAKALEGAGRNVEAAVAWRTTPWSCGPPNLAALRSPRDPWAVTITAAHSSAGCGAPASNRARLMVGAMTGDTRPRKAGPLDTTYTRRFCISWESTTRG